MATSALVPAKPLHIPAMRRELPTGWSWARLDELSLGIFDCPHSTPKLTASGPFVVRTQDIIGGAFRPDQAACVSEETYLERVSRAAPTRGDILYSREGTYFGIAAEVPESTRMCLGQRMVLIRPDESQLDFRFLRYWLNSPFMAAYIHGFREGSVAERLNLPTIRALPVLLPTISEQRAIANVLEPLEEKIELNRKMSATLEAMARALFKSWFVDFDPVRAKAEGRDPGVPADIAALFPDSLQDSNLGEIPAGWGTRTIDDLAASVLGGDWGSAAPEPGLEPAFCIRGADIPDLQGWSRGKTPLRFIKASKLESRCFRDGDLVVEISGGGPTQSTGRVALITQPLLYRFQQTLICSNFCRIVRLTDSINSYFVYLFMRDFYTRDGFFQFENGTTGIKNLDFDRFGKTVAFAYPSQSLVNRFNNLISSLFLRQQHSAAEVEILSALREALLPKLISGELPVTDAESIVEKSA